MIPTDWTGNDTWVPMATVHFAAMTAALLAGWMVTGELHLLYVAAAETGLLARRRPIFFCSRVAGNRRKRIDGNPTSREIGKILDGVSRCCMAGSVGGDGRASPEQEFRRQDQARHAIGIAELFTHLCGAAEGFLRQTGFRYRSHSDGRGFGSAGAAQPGD